MKSILTFISAMLASVSIFANDNVSDTGAWYDPAQNGHGISLFEFQVENETKQAFWWFGQDDNGDQIWLLSSTESNGDFVLYLPEMSQRGFPTAGKLEAPEVGTATLADIEDGKKLFVWDILVPEITCSDEYGFVPVGPFDPRCTDADGDFVADRVLQEGIDEQGSARFIRLTP